MIPTDTDDAGEMKSDVCFCEHVKHSGLRGRSDHIAIQEEVHRDVGTNAQQNARDV
jgi:hypothetical protein